MENRAPPHHCRVLSVGLALMLSASIAAAQETPSTTLPPPLVPATADPFDICALPVTRLMFTLADLQTRDCGGDASCSSLCWCRAWATGPVTASTLALCVPANDSSPCVGDARDCKAALSTQNATSASTNSPHSSSSSSSSSSTAGHALNTIRTDKTMEKDQPSDHGGGIGTVASIAVALVCAAVLVALAFAANWYRNRPRSVNAPATVSGGIQSGPSLSLSELDSYDGKLPGMSQPTHRGSLASLGPMHIDHNASIISGVSGASYHDIDSAHLGHLNEAHALTDTELSLSKDANERAFSPLSADGAASDIASSSFISTDSSVAIAPLGHRVGLEQYQRMQHEYHQQHGAPSDSSSFVSDISTAYLTNNESFSSQLTIPESDNGSTSSGPKEVEF